MNHEINSEPSYVDERKRQRDNRLKNKKPSKDDYEDIQYDNQSTNNRKKKKVK